MMITLPPALDRIVRDKVNAGLYASESELVCEALRREFARDTVQGWVRAQAAEGFAQLDAGESEGISREEFMARLAQRRASGAWGFPSSPSRTSRSSTITPWANGAKNRL